MIILQMLMALIRLIVVAHLAMIQIHLLKKRLVQTVIMLNVKDDLKFGTYYMRYCYFF